MHPPRRSRPFATSLPVYPFRDPEQKRRFLALVRERLSRGGGLVVIRDGSAHVEGTGAVHGLTNLAQICNQNAIEQWPRIVEEHFDKSEDEQLQAAIGGVFDSDFASSADRLAVRIYPEDFLAGGLEQHVVHRVDLPGTVTALTLDLGPSVLPLPAAVADEWGVDVGDLFECGVQNLATLCEASWQVLSVPIGAGVTLDLLGDDYYAASCILRPEPFLPRIGEHGNLMAIPARSVLLSWPIDSLQSMHPIEALITIATGKYGDGPGSITPHLFWRTKDGECRLQQGTIDGGMARLVPSPDFADLIAQLQRRRPRGRGR